MKKIIVACFLASPTICAEELIDINQPCTIKITKESLDHYRKNINEFIRTKRGERDQLSRLPNGNTFFGIAANFFIETFIAPLFNQYGNVNIEEAKLFLGRSFEKEQLLLDAINNLENSIDSMNYLITIFTQAEGEILAKKDGVEFLKIVKKVKHAKLPNPKSMGDKKENNEYSVTDSVFYDYSAATLMAFHIFENHVAPTISKKKRKHNKNLV